MAKYKSVSIRFLLALTLVIAICLGFDQRMSTWRAATYDQLKNAPHELLELQKSEFDSEYSVTGIHDLTSTTDRVFLRRRIHIDYFVKTPAVTPGCFVTIARRLEMTAGPFTTGRIEMPMEFADQMRTLTFDNPNR